MDKRWLLLGLAVAMLFCSSIACGGNTTVDTVVEDVDNVISEPVEKGFDFINWANCRLGFSTCIE